MLIRAATLEFTTVLPIFYYWEFEGRDQIVFSPTLAGFGAVFRQLADAKTKFHFSGMYLNVWQL